MDTTSHVPHFLNVLVVDDNEDAADSLELILRVWGFGVRVAYDGEKALAAAQVAQPDCILLDINMPKMDGYAVAEKIRQLPELQGVKIVALTAYSDEYRIERMARGGFNYYLNKNCELAEIRRLLDIYNSTKYREQASAQEVAHAGTTGSLAI